MIVFFVALFLLNPTLSVILFGIMLNTKKDINKYLFYAFYIMLAVYLGMLNMTKIPESDLRYHAGQYQMAKYYSFAEYLAWQGREVGFYGFNYVFYYLTGGSIKYWIFTITSVSYFMFFVAIHRFQIKIVPKPSYILFAVCLAAFFPQLFSLSAHLIRQFVAGAFFAYFLVEKIFYNRNLWWLAVMGFLIHSSSLILFPLGYVWFFKELPSVKNIKYLFYFIGLWLVLILYQLVAQTLLPLAAESDSASYALTRASADTRFNLGSFPLSNYVFILILVWMLVYNILLPKLGQKIYGMNHLLNIIVILIGFIFINIRQSELAERLFLYLCFFFPMVVPLAFKGNNMGVLRRIFNFCVILFFVYRLVNGTWHYDSIQDIMGSTTFSYITRPEFIL